jgi:uncharacterized membrane protein (DUF106 family)
MLWLSVPIMDVIKNLPEKIISSMKRFANTQKKCATSVASKSSRMKKDKNFLTLAKLQHKKSSMNSRKL